MIFDDKEYNSVEEIDAALEEEYADKDEEEETVDEELDESNKEEEETDLADEQEDEEIDEELEEDDEEEDLEGEGDETFKVDGFEFATKGERDQYLKDKDAYTKMHRTNKELRQNVEHLSERNKVLETMADQLGYKSVDDFMAAYHEQQLQEEAKKQGVDPEVLKRQRQTDEKVAKLEQDLAYERQQKQIGKFMGELDSLANEYGLSEQEKEAVIDGLENDGYTIDDITRLRSPKRLIKGYMADAIAEKEYQRKLAAAKKSKTLQEKKLKGSGDNQSNWQDEIQKEMAEYARKNGYSL